MPVGVHISSPTAAAAIKRVQLLAHCDMIDRAAGEVGQGEWQKALILNCCYGLRYEHIGQTILPNSNRNAYFAARREFFYRLYQARQEMMAK